MTRDTDGDLPVLGEGPWLGSGPVVSATFADGRRMTILRHPEMNFDVRWRDAVPGHGVIHLKRRRQTKAWRIHVGWVRGPAISYVFPPETPVSWRVALRIGLALLRDWIEADDLRGFQVAQNGGGRARYDLIDQVEAAFVGHRMPAPTTEPDR